MSSSSSDEFVPIDEVHCVVDRIIREHHARPNSSERMIVGIAGRPGSGKTHLADVLAKSIMDRTDNAIRVLVMPMDGYHLYRHELSQMPNSEYAFQRRGAFWTFNPEKLYNDLVQIAAGKEVRAPSFDHSLKDPKENDILIPVDVPIVIVEGNYLFHTNEPLWKRVSEMFALKVFLDCDPAESTERLTRRHMETFQMTREEAAARAQGSDFKNGNLIDTTKDTADIVCHSNAVFTNEGAK